MGPEFDKNRLARVAWSRRSFLTASGLVALGGIAGCASESDSKTSTGGTPGGDPKEVFTAPSTSCRVT
jgi:hypothetical protein